MSATTTADGLRKIGEGIVAKAGDDAIRAWTLSFIGCHDDAREAGKDVHAGLVLGAALIHVADAADARELREQQRRALGYWLARTM